MALKKVLDSLDGLSDDVKKEYVERDGKFHLDVDGDQSEAELERLATKHRIAEEHRAKAERLAKERQDQLDEMRRGAIPKADVEALEGSWKSKLDEISHQSKERESALQAQLNRATIGHAATAIASELFVAPDLLVDQVRNRLVADVQESGEIQVRVKGPDGKPSAMTLDDLKKEIKADKRFASVLVASKGSGGGAAGSTGAAGGGGSGGGSDKPAHEMSEKERVALYKSDPDKFKQLFGSN